jgi:thioredoxin-related protein
MNISGLVLVALFTASQYVPVTKYDAKRDAAKDIDDAIIEAQRSNRHILLEIGGEWCSWCHTLDRYFESNPQLLQLRDRNYVTVKINWSPENMNEKVLSRYGTIQTFPFFVVLDQSGKMLQAQGTGVLEQGSAYNRDKMMAFLTKWAPLPR